MIFGGLGMGARRRVLSGFEALAAGWTGKPPRHAIDGVGAARDQREQVVETGTFQTDDFTIVEHAGFVPGFALQSQELH